MYSDSVKQWNCAVGCNYGCTYCKPSFQAQMRRQIHNCELCGNYIPHFHEERLSNNWIKKNLPKKTKGDEFIWVCSSGDIAFYPGAWIEKIIEKIIEMPNRTFLFQTKNPKTFERFNFPANVILGTTIESNRSYHSISKAPTQFVRYNDFLAIKHPRKIVTIEPIMQFDLAAMVGMMKNITPERVYIGYDTRNCGLVEPRLAQTEALIKGLGKFTRVKLKYIPER